MSRVFIDSFSGAAADLKGKKRTSENVLACLRDFPRLSCFDLSEYKWLRTCINDLIASGDIEYSEAEPYPWQKFNVLTPGAEDTHS